MAAKKKIDSKTFAQNKRKRRQWLAFVRMCRYGVNNFTRNAWLTIAATAVMTITLLVIFASLAALNILNDTADTVRDRVDMSIYVSTDITDEQATAIERDLNQLESVTRVTYISPEQAREDFAQLNRNDQNTLDALNEATNQLPGTFRVNLVDINSDEELRDFVATNETYLEAQDPNREPSFASSRREAIQAIGNWTNFASRLGIGASVLFVAISSLIVFNTIRMAIFNRKDEIQMMKIIGADRNFIRGPFVVEAIVYGFIAALLATILGIGGLYAIQDRLMEGIVVTPTIDLMLVNAPFVLLGMILLGAVIGTVSSLLATRRYLRL